MGRDDRNKFLGDHSQEYWEDAQFGLKSGKSQNINSEIFANYVEMRMGNFEEQLNYLKKNEPKLYKQLDLLYNKIAKEMEKSSESNSSIYDRAIKNKLKKNG